MGNGEEGKAKNTSQSSCSLAKDRKEREVGAKLERKGEESGSRFGEENLNSPFLSVCFSLPDHIYLVDRLAFREKPLSQDQTSALEQQKPERLTHPAAVEKEVEEDAPSAPCDFRLTS